LAHRSYPFDRARRRLLTVSVERPEVSRTVDLSVPRWLQRVVAAAIAAVFAFPVVQGGVTVGFDLLGLRVDWLVEVGVSALVCVAGVAALVAWASNGDTDDSVWDAIPDRQYEGRHAESGGIARGEQERALEELKDEK
jgi:hypothetical protein